MIEASWLELHNYQSFQDQLKKRMIERTACWPQIGNRR
jgi:hypothetical protein